VDTLCKALCQVKLPDAMPGALCQAEPWGYAVQPMDVFACGVCFFIVATGTPPWREAVPSDPHFAWVRMKGVAKLLASWKRALPPDATDLLARMMAIDPALRPTMDECVQHAWFESLRSEPVPTHVASEWCRQHDRPGAESPELGFTGDVGDFYRPGEVQRSHGSGSEDVFGSSPAPEDCCLQVPSSDLELQRFTHGDAPPCTPLDGSFELEPTTVHIALGALAAPAELGNQLMSVISSAGAQITKVSPRKFSIKALVGSGGALGACTLKVRVYQKPEAGVFAVEFQRRRGSSLAFHQIFEQLADRLERSGHGDDDRGSSGSDEAQQEATPAIEKGAPRTQGSGSEAPAKGAPRNLPPRPPAMPRASNFKRRR